MIDNLIDSKKSITQEIHLPNQSSDIKILIKRDDLLHPHISGNKWRKLKYNLKEASNLGYKRLITFGGAFSNHIYSVAAAGKILGFEMIGIIRGENHSNINSTLAFARSCGMKLIYMTRSEYKDRNDKSFQERILSQYGPAYLIPEGGTNCLALKGVAEILDEIENDDINLISTAIGSGGTAAGIISALKKNQKFLGFPVLKNGNYLDKTIRELLNSCNIKSNYNWEINCNYHFGGFAKITKELVLFIDEFKRINNIQLDPIYTSKTLYGINDLLKINYFKPNTNILFIHTGGLQGLDGMKQRMDELRNKIY